MVLAGCTLPPPAAPPVPIPASTVVSGVDFSRYTQRGFLFTTEMYQGPYDAIGLITVTCYASATPDSIPDTLALGGIVYHPTWRFGEVRLERVLDSMYARATAMKADALVKFTATTTTRRDQTAEVPGIMVSGFAIHRLPK